MKNKAQKIVVASLISALICVATMIIKIPTPLKGYVNAGDGFILVGASLLSPAYSFLSAAIGSALADVLSGYTTYAPATFLIKGLMGLVTTLILLKLKEKNCKFIMKLIPAILAEVIMVLGYFIFEGILYGFGPSAVNIIPNVFQGIAGIIIGLSLMGIFEKKKIKL
ncbi:MAG: ECF transporter S component [Clostridia bacterium]|nr:ECF transporter S component [Clostridia bacterium]